MSTGGSGGAAAMVAQLSIELADLKDRIETGRRAIAYFESEIRKGGPGVASLGSALAAARTQMAGMEHQSRTTAVQIDRMVSNLAGVPRAGTSGGRALLEFSRAAEDAQYGLHGVINNIPGLLQALGTGAGLTGALSLATVGAMQLYNHWDDLVGLFREGETKSEAERMDELAKATARTVEQEKELARLRDKEAARKRQGGAEPEVEEKREQGVGKAIDDNREALISGIAATDPQLRARLDRAEEEAQGPLARAARLRRGQREGRLGPEAAAEIRLNEREAEAIRARARAEVRGSAEDLLARAEAGPEGQAELEARIRANPKAFPANVLPRLADATPEGQRAEEERKQREAIGKADVAAEKAQEKEERGRRDEERRQRDQIGKAELAADRKQEAFEKQKAEREAAETRQDAETRFPEAKLLAEDMTAALRSQGMSEEETGEKVGEAVSKFLTDRGVDPIAAGEIAVDAADKAGIDYRQELIAMARDPSKYLGTPQITSQEGLRSQFLLGGREDAQSATARNTEQMKEYLRKIADRDGGIVMDLPA